MEKYSAWATEKLAYCAVRDFVAKKDHQLRLPYSLLKTVEILVAAEENIHLAISLINRYSNFNKYEQDDKSNYSQYKIEIIKSKFLGSAFE